MIVLRENSQDIVLRRRGIFPSAGVYDNGARGSRSRCLRHIPGPLARVCFSMVTEEAVCCFRIINIPNSPQQLHCVLAKHEHRNSYRLLRQTVRLRSAGRRV